jgi:hypothetical protein
MHIGCLNGTVLKEVVVWKSKSLKPSKILIKRCNSKNKTKSIEEYLPEVELEII